MQITVTRTDIEQSADILECLKKWEAMTKIAGQHNQGSITLHTKGNNGGHGVSVSVDRYLTANMKITTPLNKAVQEIEMLVGSEMERIAREVCEILRSHMPLPLEVSAT